MITASEVRLIDDKGNNHGVIGIEKALDLADKAGLDLVEVSPNVDPPVCKILDYGKFKFEAQKKASQAKKKQKVQTVKEIKMRPGIDIHDYKVKLKAFHRFIEAGDKVKCTIRYRGREMAHKELGMEVLERIEADVAEIAKVESRPKLEGRQMSMVFAPK